MAKSVVEIIISAVNKTKKGLTEPITDLKSLQSAVSNVGPAFKVASIAAVGALAYMVKGSIDAADGFNKMSQRTGESVENLSTLAHAVDLAGVPMATLEKGLRKLSANMYDAAGGSKEAGETFKALGVTVTNSDGTLRSSTDVMKDVADKLSKMENGAAKSALMVKAFGKSGAELIPLLNGGSAAINEMQQEARDLGLEISGPTAQAAEVFNDNITRLEKVSGGFANQLMASVAPSLVTLTNSMVGAAKEGGALRIVAETIGNVFKGIVAAAFSVAAGFDVVGQGLAALAVAAGQAITGNFAGAGETLKAFKADASKTFDGLTVKWAEIYMAPNVAPTLAAVETVKVANLAAIEETSKAKLKADQESIERLGELMRVMQEADEAIAKTAEEKRIKAEEDAARRMQIEQEVAALERSLQIEKMAVEDQEFAILESHHIERLQRIDELQAKGMDAHTAARLRAMEIDNLDAQITQERIDRVKAIIDANGAATTALIAGMNTFRDNSVAGNKKIEKAFENMWLSFREGLKDAAIRAAANLLVTKAAAALAAAFWTPAAVASSVATLGAADATGVAAYAGALAAGKAATLGAVAAAHGGLDYVPKETTYLLDKGERVVSPKQNKDLTRFLEGEGGGGQTIVVKLDGRVLLKHTADAVKSGELVIDARGVK